VGARAPKHQIGGELLPHAVLEVPADVPDDSREKDRADQQVEPVEIFPQRRPLLPQHHPEIREPQAPRKRPGEGVEEERFMSIRATPAGKAMNVRITGADGRGRRSPPRGG